MVNKQKNGKPQKKKDGLRCIYGEATVENLGQISQLTESSGRFYFNHHLVILDLTSHGVEVRADCLCAIDSFLSNSQPICQFINLFLLKIHQLQVKPENKNKNSS